MQKIVVDTNIIISTAISSKGNPAKIMSLVSNKKVQLYYNAKILTEYIEVLSRARFNFSLTMQMAIIDKIKEVGILIDPPESDRELPD